MDIGSRIKHARLDADLTQEQAAEALGVSRQTISNWENEKTYPDIRSVVRMSDLYKISLDHLLREEKPMSDYLDYLADSTDVVESKNRLSRLILLVTYLAIWTAAVIVFWFFTDGSDGMGYSLMFLWVLLPVTTFVISLVIGKNNYWGRGKWFGSAAFGIMYMLAEYATFSAANMAAFDKINLPRFTMIPAGTVISLAGIAAGAVVRHYRKKKS
ncbi:helix-turn-helix transcriptional regulator [Anaerolentibacter hominis]|uniref:helix-turn-helix transcriptional regulator n=1 Tax=Anaerolentibacter hominis TaxID=3079009 RepID=UPI0031B8A033